MPFRGLSAGFERPRAGRNISPFAGGAGRRSLQPAPGNPPPGPFDHTEQTKSGERRNSRGTPQVPGGLVGEIVNRIEVAPEQTDAFNLGQF